MVLKTVHSRLWAFDAEWVPDPIAGRLLYDVPPEVQEPAEILQAMWERAGASEEHPQPFLKLAQCRVVSIAAVERREGDTGVALHLLSLPRDPKDPKQTAEAHVIGTFLDAVGQHRPQLVGFNSWGSDLKILVQRATILGLRCPEFCAPGADEADYLGSRNGLHVDLMDLLGGYGSARPSLDELAKQSGFPGKLDIDGGQVADLWVRDELERIVQYNECDALTTYLLWLRVAHFAGHFSGAAYAEEVERVRALVRSEAEGPRPHLAAYLTEWDRVAEIVSART